MNSIKEEGIVVSITTEKKEKALIAAKKEEDEKQEWIKIKINDEKDFKTFMSKYPNHTGRY